MENMCIIINKPAKRLKDFITCIAPETDILYSCVVYDMDCQGLRIRKHDNGELYMFGEKLRNNRKDYMDCHEFYMEIPADRYIYMYKDPMIRTDIELNDNTTIIAMPNAGDFTSYLAIAMYLKNKGYDPSHKIHCIPIDAIIKAEEMLMDFVTKKIELPYFETEFAKIFNEYKDKGFVSDFPISRDILYLQAETNMNNREFAAYFGTSVRNVENWRQDPGSLKDFIYDLFEYKLLKEGII